MAVLTTADLDPDGKIFIADFRDIHLLTYEGHILGLTKTRGVRFGKRPLTMTDGVWYAQEDFKAQDGHDNVRIDHTHLTLEPIE